MILTEYTYWHQTLKGFGSNCFLLALEKIKSTTFDEEIIEKAAEETGAILAVEDHSIYGGLGSMVAEVIAERRLDVNFARMGLKDFAKGYGSYDEVKERNWGGREKIILTTKKLTKGR